MTDSDRQPSNTYGSPYFPHVEVSQRKGVSPIWMLPIIALTVSVWLLYRTISEAGIPIEIIFDSAKGINVRKTKVIYQGLIVGKVVDIRLNENMKSVTVSAELINETQSMLRETTKFWLVKPELSLSGVSGLETLVSGAYIATRPGTGASKRRFFALNKVPPVDDLAPGLHLKLQAKTLGSISRGSEIYYRQIPVGTVQGYALVDNASEVLINLHIQPQFASLIRQETRFWNASGISVEGSLSGVKIRTESLSALVGGGIGFDTPQAHAQTPAAVNGDIFPLYADFDSAQDGIWVSIHFDDGGGLEENKTAVMLEGYKAGVVKKLIFDSDFSGVTARVLFNPGAQGLLKEGTQFWLVKPKIGLNGVSGLETIITGNYIAVMPGVGDESTDFSALPGAPSLPRSAPGLHITVKAKDRGSIDKKTPVYYKKIPVGSVQDYRLTPDKTSVAFDIHIKPEYSALVRRNTRFWHASGVTVKAKLTQISVRAESITSIVNGGIAFITPDETQPIAENGQSFDLFSDYDAATEGGVLENWVQKSGVTVTLRADDLGSISKGSPLYYKRMKVGEVRGYRLSKQDRYVLIDVQVQEEYQHLLKKNSRFWNVSGISIRGGLTGLNIQAQSLTTIAEGGVAFFTPDIKQKIAASAGQTYRLYDNYQAATLNGRLLYAKNALGLNIRMIAQDLGSIEVGAPVYYQKIPVGKVRHFQLGKDDQHVILNVNIEQKYTHLVHNNSRFWNASGISATANLSGIQIRTESINAILRGGIGFYSPAGSAIQSQNGATFTLYTSQESAKQDGMTLTLRFAQNQDLKVAAKLKYQGIEIGNIKDIRLNRHNTSVDVRVILYREAKHFAVRGSQFWVVQPKIGLARTENIDTLVTGNYIAAIPGTGRAQTRFKGLSAPPLRTSENGLHIVLRSPQLNAVKEKDPVYYRQIKVGKVTGFELAPSADHVLVHIDINAAYRTLVRTNSQFWNMSGIDVNFSLWSGMNVKTSTVEAILAGGIGFATPDNDQMGAPAQAGDRYFLHPQLDETWLLWAPRIPIGETAQTVLSEERR